MKTEKMKWFNFGEFEDYLGKGVLNRLWLEFDKNKQGWIDQKVVKDMLEKLMIRYADGVGMSYLVEDERVQKLFDRFIQLIFSKFDINQDGKITKEEFEQTQQHLIGLKIDMIKVIDWSPFGSYLTPDLINQLWGQFDREGKGITSRDKVKEMLERMVGQYIEGHVDVNRLGNIPGLENAQDLFSFGIVHVIVEHFLTQLWKEDSAKLSLSRQDFVAFVSWIQSFKDNLQQQLTDAVVTKTQINFIALSEYITDELIRDTWVHFDDGQESISMSQLQGVMRVMVTSYLNKAGVNATLFLNSVALTRHLEEFSQLLVQQMDTDKNGVFVCFDTIHYPIFFFFFGLNVFDVDLALLLEWDKLESLLVPFVKEHWDVVTKFGSIQQFGVYVLFFPMRVLTLYQRNNQSIMLQISRVVVRDVERALLLLLDEVVIVKEPLNGLQVNVVKSCVIQWLSQTLLRSIATCTCLVFFMFEAEKGKKERGKGGRKGKKCSQYITEL
ncbi:hypothetical protein RFI_19160 [Reticulomyxa filosa]|uniref:EF-hand domain-containing protein n=1 Tax=Reticulomyxa filosa TaxID=46433 RepID=X6MVV4_RETFI|nr:hypothetical protein RFI_19160 [Reticulomyxa filosa]|eukprot:ETO18128.1 hypothetical protein RFI_19160 [Reticulomyxa filosa]